MGSTVRWVGAIRCGQCLKGFLAATAPFRATGLIEIDKPGPVYEGTALKNKDKALLDLIHAEVEARICHPIHLVVFLQPDTATVSYYPQGSEDV